MFFARNQARGFFRCRAESKLAIEPERAGCDGFFILMAELVRIDGIARDAETLPEEFQQASVEPGGLAFAKRVIEVEADFHSLEQRQTFDVSDRKAVLEKHAAVIGSQRQAPFARDSEEENLDAAPEIGVADVLDVGMSETI